MTLDDVRTISGEGLIALHGAKTEQMIIDLLIEVLKKGRDEVNVIEQKLLQVQIISENRRRDGKVV
ncbi:hypothetical protein [Sphingomonas sp.]|uniref:hypothetical protein n=1 Tax=Sphingomonas sp. TaxID=28214 RepID=UPI000DB61E1B|nr:hypothetical protein [Sphingomonas sp.]PZU11434.1 MAG: hypothetical protein DI605_00045 [Sphingomonas sp.]